MRTVGSTQDWPQWLDPRPSRQQKKTVQIPKFWSIGISVFLENETT